MPPQPAKIEPATRPLEKFLSLFAPVRDGEGLAVVLLLVDLFLILTSYYVLKVVREPLILVGGGAEVKSYAAAGQAALLLAVLPAYGWLGSKVPRMKLVTTANAIFIVCLVIFYGLARAKVPVGVPFFLWLGIFNMFVIAQFWSLANDLFSPAQGKRLFAIIAFGGTVGAIAGAQLAKKLISVVGVYQLMLVAAGLLGVVLFLTLVGAAAAHRAPHGEDAQQSQKVDESARLGKEGGFALVWKDRYLLLIAVLVLIFNTVNSTGEFILGKTVAAAAASQAAEALPGAAADALEEKQGALIGAFYGDFFTWVNILTAAIQLFLVSRILKIFGVRVALLVLPAIALGGYGLLALVPLLSVVKTAKILENSVDYSLYNTTRQALWLPTSREAKYKAKVAVDTFFVRFGDMAAAGLVALGTLLSFSPRAFAAVNAGLVLFWLGIAVALGRRHTQLTGGSPGRAGT